MGISKKVAKNGDGRDEIRSPRTPERRVTRAAVRAGLNDATERSGEPSSLSNPAQVGPPTSPVRDMPEPPCSAGGVARETLAPSIGDSEESQRLAAGGSVDEDTDDRRAKIESKDSPVPEKHAPRPRRMSPSSPLAAPLQPFPHSPTLAATYTIYAAAAKQATSFSSPRTPVKGKGNGKTGTVAGEAGERGESNSSSCSGAGGSSGVWPEKGPPPILSTEVARAEEDEKVRDMLLTVRSFWKVCPSRKNVGCSG